MKDDYLAHYGILGQKWGVKNGPPYPLSGGQFSASERKERYKPRDSKNSLYNKRHIDTTLQKGKVTLSTLSYDKNRTTNAEMFYATWDFFDKHMYGSWFNAKVDKDITDEYGKVIGKSSCFKYKISNKLTSDMRVASEDSSAKVFRDLYSKNRDFYNFVTDENRMQSYFVNSKYKFRGYREGRDILEKMRKDQHYVPTSKDLQKVYRLFNYVIPYDGAGDAKKGHDVKVQRAKFFKECKKAGYGAVLDTNDAMYGSFKARSPVIVFDMDSVTPSSVRQTHITDKMISDGVMVFKHMMRIR